MNQTYQNDLLTFPVKLTHVERCLAIEYVFVPFFCLPDTNIL